MRQVIAIKDVRDRLPVRNIQPAPREAPSATLDRVKDHPCYNEDAHHYFSRMHLAVAPACNIQCNYCNRKYDCANESRPGVTSERLTPDQALERVKATATAMPNLSVIGIAGPGDALCNAKQTFETLEMVRGAFPDLTLCLSTNGLSVLDHVDRIRALQIDHVTVTINALDPDIATRIYAWVGWRGKRMTGRDGAALLLERQWDGLTALVEAGVLVKVNSVMIPGINDDHLPEVNAAVRARGAFLHNIMPLIADPSHGTVFGLEGRKGPSPESLTTMQDQMGEGARLMRHCRQCRADAVGLLGDQGCGAKTPVTASAHSDEDLAAGIEARTKYRRFVAQDRQDRVEAASTSQRLLAQNPPASQLVAVTTKGGGRVNRHFGKATEFQLYRVDASGVRPAGIRRADPYCRGVGSRARMARIIEALAGVSLVLCQKIGTGPKEELEAAGIAVREDFAGTYIEAAVASAVSEPVVETRRA